MKKVLIRGPLLTQSGYGEHARQVYRYCETRKDWDLTAQVLQWGITPWNVDADAENGLIGRIMSNSKPPQGKFDITIQIQLPHEWDPSLGNYNIGVTAGIETDRSSNEWATVHREKMDLVIVPSEHAKSSLRVSGTGREKTPVVVVPEAYFEELLEASTTDPIAHIPTDKNFLVVGTLTADDPAANRKNLLSSIRWFLQRFDGDDSVGLIVKTTKGRDTSIDRELVRKMLRNLVAKSGAKRPPKVYMLHGSMTRQEMRDLYRSPKVSAFVSSTRGEGFGLPLLEAAVVGIPVVATDWSAHTEFLDGPSFLRVQHDLRPIPSSRADGKIFAPGSKWAEAREGNFKKKLSQAIADTEQIREAAMSLSQKLQASHSLSTIFGAYDAALQGTPAAR